MSCIRPVILDHLCASLALVACVGTVQLLSANTLPTWCVTGSSTGYSTTLCVTNFWHTPSQDCSLERTSTCRIQRPTVAAARRDRLRRTPSGLSSTSPERPCSPAQPPFLTTSCDAYSCPDVCSSSSTNPAADSCSRNFRTASSQHSSTPQTGTFRHFNHTWTVLCVTWHCSNFFFLLGHFLIWGAWCIP